MSGGPLPRPAGKVGACVVIAEFEVKPESFGDFAALARRFAEECVESEPGCRQFDVVQLETTPRGVLFYEAYDDAAAFEAHCGSAHLARFRAAFAPLIVGERPLRRGLA
ncbi:putative quinol monooxygenase [Polaromonas jejuensis]|uniref:Quinol monooxygenase n=1 Tax=Polaromonas jejuensis TaxID=457502 RepID=A0ABW0QAZ4_9BURK|nr:putative quinol monooxygenase [Polaromonas jejuensis]